MRTSQTWVSPGVEGDEDWVVEHTKFYSKWGEDFVCELWRELVSNTVSVDWFVKDDDIILEFYEDKGFFIETEPVGGWVLV